MRTRPDRPWGLSILLYNGCWVFPGGKEVGCGADHPPPSKCRRHGKVELYLYSPSAPQWSVIWRTFEHNFLGLRQLTIAEQDCTVPKIMQTNFLIVGDTDTFRFLVVFSHLTTSE